MALQSLWAYGIGLEPFNIETCAFNWKPAKLGGYLLSPYLERIFPYSESDFEVSYLQSKVKSELIHVEENRCLLLSQRQKFGKYPNLRPLGFLNNYQKSQNGLLLPNANASPPNLVNALQLFNATGITVAQASQAMIKALTNLGSAISVPMKMQTKLTHGKLDYPVIGYRRFNVREYGDKVAVASLNPSDLPGWVSKTHTEAVCLQGETHRVPDEYCTCGIYSYSSLKLAFQNWWKSEVIASIVAWGKIVQHDDEGFRAEKARIIGFLAPEAALNEMMSYRRVNPKSLLWSDGIFFRNDSLQEMTDLVSMDKLSEKYQVPVFHSAKYMQAAALEYGNVLPNEPAFDV